jgi:hypothetical protein
MLSFSKGDFDTIAMISFHAPESSILPAMSCPRPKASVRKGQAAAAIAMRHTPYRVAPGSCGGHNAENSIQGMEQTSSVAAIASIFCLSFGSPAPPPAGPPFAEATVGARKARPVATPSTSRRGMRSDGSVRAASVCDAQCLCGEMTHKKGAGLGL